MNPISTSTEMTNALDRHFFSPPNHQGLAAVVWLLLLPGPAAAMTGSPEMALLFLQPCIWVAFSSANVHLAPPGRKLAAFFFGVFAYPLTWWMAGRISGGFGVPFFLANGLVLAAAIAWLCYLHHAAKKRCPKH